MVLYNDRTKAMGSGDFNNPSGTYSLTPHGYEDEARWAEMSVPEARPEVHGYYAGQKDTQTWREAARLAKRRADHQNRKHGLVTGADYANAYADHMVRVMNDKGSALADQYGELHHRQSGYGRT